MKKMLSAVAVLLLVLFTNASVAQNDPAATLTSMIRKGTCSLKDSSWCPTYASAVKGGFVLNATATSIVGISLKYEDLSVACFIWKNAGGGATDEAILLVTDAKGVTLLLNRKC